MVVQIYGAAPSLVATIQPEQVICSEITDTEDGERSINDVMDRSREREVDRVVNEFLAVQRQCILNETLALTSDGFWEVFHSSALDHLRKKHQQSSSYAL